MTRVSLQTGRVWLANCSTLNRQRAMISYALFKCLLHLENVAGRIKEPRKLAKGPTHSSCKTCVPTKESSFGWESCLFTCCRPRPPLSFHLLPNPCTCHRVLHLLSLASAHRPLRNHRVLSYRGLPLCVYRPQSPLSQLNSHQVRAYCKSPSASAQCYSLTSAC